MSEQDPFYGEILKALAFGGAVAAIPLVASFQQLQPPWPPAIGPVSAAVIVIGAVLARVFGGEVSRRARRRLLLLAAALSLVGLFGYLFLYARLVIPIDEHTRVVLGFACNDETQALYPSICPNLTELELSRARYNPERLFTPMSHIAARLVLDAAWMLFMAGLVSAVAWAVAAAQGKGADR